LVICCTPGLSRVGYLRVSFEVIPSSGMCVHMQRDTVEPKTVACFHSNAFSGGAPLTDPVPLAWIRNGTSPWRV
jgi:hypothetical protein